MPAPQKAMLTQLTKTNFIAKAIKLPENWKNPGDQYPDAFDASERTVPPAPPTNLFRGATLNKYHVDTAKEIGKLFEDYIEGICDAICSAIDNWMKMSTVVGILINGPVGTVLPGNVLGPPIGPIILAKAPKNTPQALKYSNAIANTMGMQWQLWHVGLAGMLQYPAFAAFPGPVGPPMPNVPVPVMMLSSPGETGLSPSTLKSLMEANLADPQALHAPALFDSIAKAFNNVFQIFKMSTLVTNVLGTGPIPTFAPPFVPVGPVVAGTSIPVPGVFK